MITQSHNLKIHRLYSELLCIVAIVVLTLCSYYPFLSGSNIGGADAQFYQYILHDSIVQIGSGFFPTYISQSVFSPNGLLLIIAPFYLLLGQLLNAISFGELNSLIIQHLTILFSAISAASILYALIRNIAPKLHWQAVFLSFVYISCPGVMSLIYHMDMYYSFMAVPFVPVAFYGLVRIYQRDDALAYVITAAALSLIWLSHAPIALWVCIISFVFCLLLIFIRKRKPKKFISLALLFGLLSLWQFVPVLTLRLNATGIVLWNSEIPRVDQVVSLLLLAVPDVFLPLSQGTAGFYFLQLGYFLWFVIAISLVVAFRSSGVVLVRFFLVLIAIVLLYIYPVGFVGHFLWSVLPEFVLDITNIYPNQRLYVILAALVCIVGALALQEISLSRNSNFRIFVSVVLGVLFIWNIYQVDFFVRYGNAVKAANESTTNPKDSWSTSDNIGFVGFGLPKEYLLNFYTGTNDSLLKSRLLDSNKVPVREFDNEQFVIDQCLRAEKKTGDFDRVEAVEFPLERDLKEPFLIAKMNFLPNIRYLVCAEMSVVRGYALFQLLDLQSRERVALEIPGGDDPSIRRRIGIPFYFGDLSRKENAGGLFNFRVWSREQPTLRIFDIGVTSYKSEDLPIVIESYTPYRAKVVTRPDHRFLEVLKLYFPGYRARVNGVEVKVVESDRNTILIPLKDSGVNKVELAYVGTMSSRLSFYLSALTWLLVIAFVLTKIIQKFKKRSCEG